MYTKRKGKIICWWSGGITSAVACKIAIDTYGHDRCEVVFIDTKNEDEDTGRFMNDCAKWYAKSIDTISAMPNKWEDIQDVWRSRQSLNVAHGAICSSELKRQVRVDFQRRHGNIAYQVFGFDDSEHGRAKNIKKNYAGCYPVFPLLMYGLSKSDCLKIVSEAEIEVPRMYGLGFTNNNCFKTGCVQGGIGYWKKMQSEFPDKFAAMAAMEHELTDAKGQPVTCLKDQSKEAKTSGVFQVFLVKHRDYPNNKSIDEMKGVPIKSLANCNGFCGTQAKLQL